MIDHIVLFKLKRGAKTNDIENMYRNFIELKDKIQGIISITGGKDISSEGKNQGYTYGFVVKFADTKARDDYLPHPEHKKLIDQFIIPVVEDALVFDY
jgi:hypothetical protein